MEEGDEMGRVSAARAEYDRTTAAQEKARQALHAAILAALAAGLPIDQVARNSGYDREHVRRIRDGEQ